MMSTTTTNGIPNQVQLYGGPLDGLSVEVAGISHAGAGVSFDVFYIGKKEQSWRLAKPDETPTHCATYRTTVTPGIARHRHIRSFHP